MNTNHTLHATEFLRLGTGTVTLCGYEKHYSKRAEVEQVLADDGWSVINWITLDEKANFNNLKCDLVVVVTTALECVVFNNGYEYVETFTTPTKQIPIFHWYNQDFSGETNITPPNMVI